MADTVNLSEGARLLGLSQRTVRKKLSPRYRREDRIRGAKKRGRDWEISRSEIRRIMDLRVKRIDESINWNQAFAVAFQVCDDLEDEYRARLLKAARALVEGEDNETASGEELRDLRSALNDFDAINSMSGLIIDKIAYQVKDREFLESVGYP